MERENELERSKIPQEPPPTVRPTLVIGLGGTGHRILLHLKRQLIRAYGGVPEARIRLLAFDTADEPLAVSLEGELISLETDRELFNVGRTPVPNILRNLDRQPAIAARLPSIQAIPAVALRGGARQIRPLGLVALLWRFDEVEERVEEAIWQLAGKETLGRREGITQGINVFICNSLVGGTGAGMFLDVAYLVRALFAELGGMGDFCYITGVGVLPQVFRRIEGPNIIPNAVAALKELNYCMLRGDFSCQYPNGRWIRSLQPPFDLYYLVDGVDEQGYTWRGLDELCAMIAAGLFLQIGSQVGRKGENDFDNLSDVLSGQTADGYGTFCGSFGMATLVFQAPQIAAWCSARLAVQMIDAGLLRPADPAVARAEAGAFLKAHIPRMDALLQELGQDENGVPLVIDLRFPERSRQGRDALTPSGVIRRVHDYRHVRLEGDYRTWIRANSRAIAAQMEQALEERVCAALADPAVGVNGALALLESVAFLLSKLTDRLENRRAAAEAESRRLETEMAAREEAARQAANTLFLWRKQAVVAACDRYLKVAAAGLAQALQEMICEGALTVVVHLGRAAETWQQRLKGLRSALTAARRQLVEEKAAILEAQEQGEVASINLADPAYCQALYQRYAPPPLDALAELLREESLIDWSDLPSAELVARLRTVAMRPFQPLSRMSVEDALRDRADETSPQSYKERLFRLAAPSWNLDLTRLEDGGALLRTVQVLGVPEEERSLFRSEMQSLVSTHAPTAIVAFLATIGAPYSALQQYPDYERVYLSVRGGQPLHVLPQFQAEGRQAKLAFALGIVFGMIFSRGFYFYYRPEDPLDPPLKLDNGLANALRRFAQSDTLVQETMGRVEQRIAEMGTTAALSLLTSYYATGEGGREAGGATDALVLEMRKLVRAYAGELRRTQQALGGPQGGGG